MRPHGSALASAMVLTISTIFARAATPAFCNCRNDSCAAAQASLASANTPNFPRSPGDDAWPLPLQPQSDLAASAGAGAGAEVLGPGAPPRRPSTSPTISRIKASLTALIEKGPKVEIRYSKEVRVPKSEWAPEGHN